MVTKIECVCCDFMVFPENEEEKRGFLENWKLCQKHREEIEMLKPKNNERKFVNEAVPTEEWLVATIEDIGYEESHEFGGQFAKTGEGVRFKFKLDGAYEHPKYSRWLAFSYSEKSNLFNKFLKPLVRDAKPYFDFDIFSLKGTRCRLMFTEDTNDKGDVFYNIEMVKPLKDEKKVDSMPTIQLEEDNEQNPF